MDVKETDVRGMHTYVETPSRVGSERCRIVFLESLCGKVCAEPASRTLGLDISLVAASRSIVPSAGLMSLFDTDLACV